MMEEGLGLQKMMMKTFPSKALVFRINLVFLAFFLLVYAALFLRQSSSFYSEDAAISVARISLREWHHKVGKGLELKVQETEPNSPKTKGNLSKIEMPSFMMEMKGGMKIGKVNMEDFDVSEWSANNFKATIPVKFERISEYFEWKDLFPEWIDEEEEIIEVPTCPEVLPMPDFRRYENMDMIVPKLPCKFAEEDWGRDVFRLQFHLVAANLAVKRGKMDWNGRKKVVFLSKCRPMMELFRCDDLARREGDWWFMVV